MTTVVQITGCFEAEGEDGATEVIPFVSNEDADFYGIYLGKGGEFAWQADFLHYEDALTYATAVSKTYGYQLDDKTYIDGDSNGTRH